jgi:very-long-chain (3R)-3-hydroxyacyl-CoA dehydratase
MTLSSIYLTAYNSLSCALWAYLTVRALTSAPALYAEGRLHQLYHELLFPLLAGTQSLAVLEIFHAATGLVRASPVTTAIQVIGKNLVVWTVMAAFPEIVVGRDGHDASGVWPFVGCVVFWGVAEVVRYGYFVVLLVRGEAPGWLKWLRYAKRYGFLREKEEELTCCTGTALLSFCTRLA